MEKQLEYFDVVANSQKQVLANLASVQKDATAQLLDALNKTQTALTSMPVIPDTPQAKEAVTQFSAWFDTAASNAKLAFEAAANAQKLWIGAYEKQLSVGRGVLKNAIEMSSPVTKTA